MHDPTLTECIVKIEWWLHSSHTHAVWFYCSCCCHRADIYEFPGAVDTQLIICCVVFQVVHNYCQRTLWEIKGDNEVNSCCNNCSVSNKMVFFSGSIELRTKSVHLMYAWFSVNANCNDESRYVYTHQKESMLWLGFEQWAYKGLLMLLHYNSTLKIM